MNEQTVIDLRTQADAALETYHTARLEGTLTQRIDAYQKYLNAYSTWARASSDFAYHAACRKYGITPHVNGVAPGLVVATASA